MNQNSTQGTDVPANVVELTDEALDAVSGGTKDLEADDRLQNFEIQDLLDTPAPVKKPPPPPTTSQRNR